MTNNITNPHPGSGQLRPIRCPGCHQLIEARPGQAVAATSYETCLRQCPACGIGFSNARTADPTRLTVIRREPLTNVPAEVRAGADLALHSALNEDNRENKWRKFGFSTSEDALTWTVFSHLEATGQLRNTLAALHLPPAVHAAAEPVLLLWGAPVGQRQAAGQAIRARLSGLCDQLGERPNRRSEPDVILDFGPHGLILIEVKLRSGNERKAADYPHWRSYADTDAFSDYAGIRQTGFYELARNWRLGHGLADGRPMALISLAPAALFRKEDRALAAFAAGLNQDRHRFVRLTWESLLPTLRPEPDWLAAWLRPRAGWCS